MAKSSDCRIEMSEIAIRNLPASAGSKKAISESQKSKISDDAQKLKLLTHAQEHAPGFSPGVLDSGEAKV